jgi:hypothetical protein
LLGFGLRDDIKIISSGKIASAFDMIKRCALGADVCYSARSMMIALGCIQALRCNTNHCPVGVAIQNPHLEKGLHPPHKRTRVARFHEETIKSLAHMLGAMGLNHTDELRPWHVMKRIDSTQTRHYGQLYHYLNAGDFSRGHFPDDYKWSYNMAQSSSFDPVENQFPEGIVCD